MTNEIEIRIIDGYWSINGKPIQNCSIPKKMLFAQFVKMKMVKMPISKSQEFHQNKEVVKETFNHRFKIKLEQISNSFFNEEPNTNNLTFERKQA